MVAKRKSDDVADALLAEIVGGELPKGTVIPDEDALAERFGVNRSAVREAVKRLEVHRLVRPVRRRGTEVLDPLASLSPEVVRAMLRGPDGAVSRPMLESILELRVLVDVEIVRLAALRRTDEEAAELERLAEAAIAQAADPTAHAAAIETLGHAVARATKNPLFAMLVHWHRHVFSDLPELVEAIRAPTPLFREGLRMLVRAIREGDVETATALAREHHRQSSERLLASLKEEERAR